MSDLIPIADESNQPFGQFLLIGEFDDPQPFSLEDAEPLFHLVHPGIMNGRVMKHEPRVLDQPRLHLLAFMHPQVVQHDVDRLHRLRDLSVELFQESDELRLPLSLRGHPVDLPGPRVESREQIQRATSTVSAEIGITLLDLHE